MERFERSCPTGSSGRLAQGTSAPALPDHPRLQLLRHGVGGDGSRRRRGSRRAPTQACLDLKEFKLLLDVVVLERTATTRRTPSLRGGRGT